MDQVGLRVGVSEQLRSRKTEKNSSHDHVCAAQLHRKHFRGTPDEIRSCSLKRAVISMCDVYFIFPLDPTTRNSQRAIVLQ